MKLRLIYAVCILVCLSTGLIADIVSVQPTDAYSTVLGSAGWQTPQKIYTITNTCSDYVYWQAGSDMSQTACQPPGGWIAPGASRNVSLRPAGFMTVFAPGTYSDQITLDFDPRVLGDANGDGFVNIGDLQKLVVGWGSSTGGPMYQLQLPCDLNNDGHINVGDLQLLIQRWGQSYTMTST